MSGCGTTGVHELFKLSGNSSGLLVSPMLITMGGVLFWLLVPSLVVHCSVVGFGSCLFWIALVKAVSSFDSLECSFKGTWVKPELLILRRDLFGLRDLPMLFKLEEDCSGLISCSVLDALAEAGPVLVN